MSVKSYVTKENIFINIIEIKSMDLWNFRHIEDEDKANPQNPTWFIMDENDIPVLAIYRLQTDEFSPVKGEEVTPDMMFEWGDLLTIDKYKLREKKTLKLLYFNENYKTIDFAREIQKVDPYFEFKEDVILRDVADNMELAEYINIEEVLEMLDLSEIDGWFQDKHGDYQNIVEIMLTSKGKKKIKFLNTKTLLEYF